LLPEQGADAPAARAFFLPSSVSALPSNTAQRFCIYHPAAGDRPRGALVHVHAWAEEMNKARRMVALQARALARAGYAVLLIDLQGCGDSAGDFADATWQAWLADVQAAVQWLQQQCSAPVCLWGLRAGCLLAAQAAHEMNLACDFLFWQPATQGKALLQQFLRLKAAAQMQQQDAKTTLAQLRAALDAGRGVEVAGYGISAALALGLEQATLLMPNTRCRVLWLETSPREDAQLLPVSQSTVQAWQAAGHQVTAQVVPGPAFWQTQEIEDAPALLGATLAALQAEGGR
jgi:uncharacterized protein